MNLTQKEIALVKQRIKEETKRCMQDPIYFMKKYVKIQHPQRGTIPFELYKFQEETLGDFHKYNKNIVLKSRQMGISTLVAAYSLWLMLFHTDKNILIISIKEETSKEIVTKVKFANANLPQWLKIEPENESQLTLRLKNGSQIKAVSSAGTAGRSSSLSLLIIDEAAFVPNAEQIWVSAQSTLSTGGKAILLSTPDGAGNFFHRMWVEAEEGANSFHPIKLPWHRHPERDQAWRDLQTKMLGEKGANQECECSFLVSGNSVIDPLILEEYKEKYITDPIEKLDPIRNLWVWKRPEEGKKYIVAADVSRGDATDSSACHVIDQETLEQVAEFKGMITTREYGELLVKISIEYNSALLVVERENVGWAVIQRIIDLEYPNTFYSTNDLKYVQTHKQMTSKVYQTEKKMLPGFATTIKNRQLLISKLELYFRERAIQIYSNRLLEELKVFVWENHKAQAMKGYNDDLVMALAIAMWIRDTALRMETEKVAVTKSMLNNINFMNSKDADTNMTASIVANNKAKTFEQWTMPIGGSAGRGGPQQRENLDWLL